MTAVERERIARATLSIIGEPGQLSVTEAVAADSGEQVLGWLLEHCQPDLAARLGEADAEGMLERADRLRIRFVIPGDAEWPTSLDDLARTAPLHERGGTPVGLWVKGPLSLAGATDHAVAVVGSRSATTYGTDAAGEIGAGVAREGYTVVSGAAAGIDQAAHRGALAVRGPTIAVLACGPDRAYPEAHRNLLDYIADVGAVVSESPPGCAPTRIRFLARNRIIAGLSRGTVIVEAAVRSGALNTATWTLGLGRPTMGVPGPVTSAPSEGVHQLIRHRDAVLVTRAEEVLEVVGPIGSFALAEPRAEAGPRDRLSHVQRQVLDAVPVRAGARLSRIARTAGLSPEKTGAALGTLRHLGLVECFDQRWRLPAGGTTSS
ncbi:MAG TPA: DNA-processing protein DprA [Marmoricola sp.]|jgi:DNA processing protein|nr:DNA-processing protein DprA [Marmoricola sp.]